VAELQKTLRLDRVPARARSSDVAGFVAWAAISWLVVVVSAGSVAVIGYLGYRLLGL
jgi:hypothetical protein